MDNHHEIGGEPRRKVLPVVAQNGRKLLVGEFQLRPVAGFDDGHPAGQIVQHGEVHGFVQFFLFVFHAFVLPPVRYALTFDSHFI